MAEDNSLNALAARHGSDKWGPHSYTRHYETHFAKFRHRPINILEIGIGGYKNPLAGGASLRMWCDYFPEAVIYGLDYYEKTFPRDERIRIYQGSQTDADLLRKINDEAAGFDIIVDDGSHLNSDVIASFNILFPLLRPDGLYVVEDTQTSYWPVLGGSSRDPDSPATMIGFFKSLIHGVNHAEIIGRRSGEGKYDLSIVALSFYHNMVFVEKGDNSEASNIGDGDPLRAP